MWRWFSLSAWVLSFCTAIAGSAGASPHTQATGVTIPPATYAIIGGPTRIPHGWVDFCGRRPEECKVPPLPAVDVKLSLHTWQILDRINREVNAAIVPISNLDHWGTTVDHWDYPVDGMGDCKIYALEKRRLLMEEGFPRQALLMTIVRDLNGEGHAILTVKTDRGDFILDNMVGNIRSWDATGYEFYSRQSQENPNVWVAIEPGVAGVPEASTRLANSAN
ncbi:transglutaminase [Labrys miyagiensis]|uniref:Transglutaminase n=1 Tax=Labrys miyagiensis TaxID=346912 RepID=A0ABQ6CIQ8_9HYPH|nr:transglutaminase-like cysteine peptidase [Labrys miyagiensis]GLS18599.1 transglutaminase [Labrys miyagiensis]